MPASIIPGNNGAATIAAVIFDLDGVLVDTAELHYQSWADLAREHEIPFDRAANEALRGLSRPESLKIFLGTHAQRFTEQERLAIMDAKNTRYIERLKELKPEDALPGARELLEALRARGVKVAVASSSKNARPAIEQIEIGHLLDAVVDGRDITHSKPHPEVFLKAAQKLNTPPARCVVVEDAESGVEGALAAGMAVIGIGPPERVGKANHIVAGVADLDVDTVLSVKPR